MTVALRSFIALLAALVLGGAQAACACAHAHEAGYVGAEAPAAEHHGHGDHGAAHSDAHGHHAPVGGAGAPLDHCDTEQPPLACDHAVDIEVVAAKADLPSASKAPVEASYAPPAPGAAAPQYDSQAPPAWRLRASPPTVSPVSLKVRSLN